MTRTLCSLRVTRWLTVIDGGRMINQKAARNQIIGSVVMGIGMGLLEETIYDPRTGHPVNNNYADYLVAVQTDVPEIECVFLDYPDTILNAYGARGIGEIGLTGCAAALTLPPIMRRASGCANYRFVSKNCLTALLQCPHCHLVRCAERQGALGYQRWRCCRRLRLDHWWHDDQGYCQNQSLAACHGFFLLCGVRTEATA